MATAVDTAPSLDRLLSEVISPGLCVACGACVGLCPHIIIYDGQVAAPDACGLDQGRCYDLCPQTPDRDRSRQGAESPLGPVKAAWQGRAADQSLKDVVQYGGAASVLVSLALESGRVQGAALTAAGKRGAPRGIMAADRDQVLAAAGSIYAAGGGLAELNRALAQPGDEPLAVVGLPCQMLAAAGMKAHPDYPQAKRIKLTIGLFCTWNLTARGLRALLAEKGVGGRVQKMDIPPPPAEVFRVAAGGRDYDIPLAEVREKTMAGCALCPDMTAEAADVSVGAAEGRPGWNTILARSEAGVRLTTEAAEKGLLILEPADEVSMDHLRVAAAAKRERARQASKERSHG